jgi:hypothetical protein
MAGARVAVIMAGIQCEGQAPMSWAAQIPSEPAGPAAIWSLGEDFSA